jgi:hypothetical protein
LSLKSLSFAAALAAAPAAASAATVVAGGFFDSYAAVLSNGSSFTQDFIAGENILVDLSFSSSGLPANVSLLRYGVDGADEPFDVMVFGNLASGAGSLVDLSFLNGEMFSVMIEPDSALSDNTEVGFSIFAETAIAPIPLPAAGWMLLAGLGGIAALSRRRPA